MNNKLHFINFLRGLSCLIIMIGHLVLNFFTTTDWSVFPYIPSQTFDNQLVAVIHSFFSSFDFNFGAFGVAVFLMITGFVTVMSLERDCTFRYVLKRVFRIYPTYVVGFSCTLISIYIWCRYTSYAFPFSFKECFNHMTLFRNFLCSTYIDNGVWTLEINMDFYILMFVLFNVFALQEKNGSKSTLTISSLITIYGIWYYEIYNSYYSTNTYMSYILSVLGDISFFLVITLIGSLFYYLYSNQVTTKKFVYCFIIMLFEALILNHCRIYPVWIASYVYAIAIFGFTYVLRNNFMTPKFIGFISDISYPLYIVHGLVGYIAMSYLISKGFYSYFALLITLVLVITLAYLIHVFIDKYSNKVCEKIIKNMGNNNTLN